MRTLKHDDDCSCQHIIRSTNANVHALPLPGVGQRCPLPSLLLPVPADVRRSLLPTLRDGGDLVNARRAALGRYRDRRSDDDYDCSLRYCIPSPPSCSPPPRLLLTLFVVNATEESIASTIGTGDGGGGGGGWRQRCWGLYNCLDAWMRAGTHGCVLARMSGNLRTFEYVRTCEYARKIAPS